MKPISQERPGRLFLRSGPCMDPIILHWYTVFWHQLSLTCGRRQSHNAPILPCLPGTCLIFLCNPVLLSDASDFSEETRRALRSCEQRSEEHTSELQSHHDLVCRLLL